MNKIDIGKLIPPGFAQRTKLDKRVVEMVINQMLHPLWHQHASGYEEALKIAVPDLPLLVAFTGDFCTFCKDLKSEVFDTFAFGAWVFEKHLLLVSIEYSGVLPPPAKDVELVQQYQVEGFPTVIGLNPDGTERGRVVGYAPGTGVTNWIQQFTTATQMKRSPVPFLHAGKRVA